MSGKVSNASEYTAEELNAKEAQGFLESIKHSPVLISPAKYIGLFFSGKLVAVAQFTLPQDILVAKKHSIELYSYTFSEDQFRLDGLNVVLEVYKSTFHPTDIGLIVNQGYAHYESLGFQSGSNSNSEGKALFSWFNRDLTFYLYKITASDSDKYYYGVSHVKKQSATEDDCLRDGYFGSGGASPTNKFRAWKAKHGEALKKEIMGLYGTKAEVYEAESLIVGDLWRTDPLCLNSTVGGKMAAPNSFIGVAKGTCPIHGDVTFMGNECRSCKLQSLSSTEDCPTHGLVSHFSGHCRACLLESSYTQGTCTIHAETTFQKGVCLKCRQGGLYQEAACRIHGPTLHQGLQCLKCQAQATFQEATCEVHGLTTFVGSSCSKCLHAKAVAEKECAIHGVTKHRGDSCFKCYHEKARSMGECEIHGTTSFQGEHCISCLRSSAMSERECPTHGKAKFQGKTCTKCSSAKANTEKECSWHGMAKHLGDSCRKCAGEKRAHKRYRGTNPKEECSYCQGLRTLDS